MPAGCNTGRYPAATPSTCNCERSRLDPLCVLLSDSLSDIGVASNDLGIADQSYMRLCRAQD